MDDVRRNDFSSRIGEALAYPFKGDGKFLLLVGTLFFGLLDWMSNIWVAGIVVSVFSMGYISAYLFKVISASALGKAELPDWPSFMDFQSDILTPLFHVLGTVLVAFGPILFYWNWSVANGGAPDFSNPICILLLAGGVVYWPMAMIAIALFKSIGALNPILVLSSILRVPGAYGGACLMFGLVLGANLGIQSILPESVPLVGPLLMGFCGLYFMFVEMRVLGMLYYDNSERLGWFAT